MAELNGFTAKNIVAVVFDVSALLTKGTPRATSWAANNWVPQSGIPFRETVGSPDGNPSAGATVRSSALASLASSYKIRDGDIFVSNNVPYIQPLNNGHSLQAPAGFVQIAVLKAVDNAKKFKLV